MADTDVIVHSDGCVYTVKAGTQIRLTPGEKYYCDKRIVP